MSIIVIDATPNIARTAQSLAESVIFIQPSSRTTPVPLREGIDELFQVDLKDERALINLGERLRRTKQPKAAVSVTENGLMAAAVLTDLLGTPGTPVSVVENIQNKLKMRSILAIDAPEITVDYADALDHDSAAKLLSQHRRVIHKPIVGTASQGVSLLKEIDDVRAIPGHDGYILEAFADGTEYSVETFSREGRHRIIAIVQQEKSPIGQFVEVSHFLPPPAFNERIAAQVSGAVATLLDALNVRNGPTHTEVKVKGDVVKIIETHNRPAGDGLADLVAITTGLDWRRISIGWPLGIGIEASTPKAPAAAITFFTAPPGRVVATHSPRTTFSNATVDRWALDVQVGDTVNKLRQSGDRIGFALISGDSAEACHRAVSVLQAEPMVEVAGHGA